MITKKEMYRQLDKLPAGLLVVAKVDVLTVVGKAEYRTRPIFLGLLLNNGRRRVPLMSVRCSLPGWQKRSQDALQKLNKWFEEYKEERRIK